MNGVGARDFGGGDDAFNAQVTVLAGRWTNAHGFIGLLNPRTITVRNAVHANRTHAQLAASANHTQRDFSSIGDQNSFKHDG
jgi:hypothetical protein